MVQNRPAEDRKVEVSDSDLVEVVKRNAEFRKCGPFWGRCYIFVPERSPSSSIYSVEGAGSGWRHRGRVLVALWLAIMAVTVAVAFLVGDVRLNAKKGIGQFDPFNSFLVTLLVVEVPVQ
jgi:hypothetical protein